MKDEVHERLQERLREVEGPVTDSLLEHLRTQAELEVRAESEVAELERNLADIRSGKAAERQERARQEAMAEAERVEGERLAFERRVAEEARRLTAVRHPGQNLGGYIHPAVREQVRRRRR